MSNAVELQVNISIKGRQLDTLRFQDGEISIGREQGSAIFLDNPGVSRQHAKIEISGTDVEIVDTQSGNGTFVNDQQIQRSPLKNGDTVRIGKFTLDIAISAAQGAAEAPQSSAAAPLDEADQTVFLQAGEQAKIHTESRQAERGVPAPSTPATSRVRDTDKRESGSNTKIFIMGVILGAFLVWLITS